MSLSIVNNLASQINEDCRDRLGSLAASMQRLSTGLRINSAADDAAGLAIRELQRSDIAVLHQGIRNASEAISLLQVADSALGVIDEKLIRMKELAEQAATGTYDSVQRALICAEFQAMGSEINRIAAATDFNGIHLLNGDLHGAHRGDGLNSSGALKIHFGTGNDSAEDYYYIDIGDCSCTALFPPEYEIFVGYASIPIKWPDATMEDGHYVFTVTGLISGTKYKSPNAVAKGLDAYEIPSGLKNVVITSNGYSIAVHKPHVSLFSADGAQLTGYPVNDSRYNFDWWNKLTGDEVVKLKGFNEGAKYTNAYNAFTKIKVSGQTKYDGMTITSVDGINEDYTDQETITIDQVTDNLVFLIGGHENSYCNIYDLTITCDIPINTEFIPIYALPSINSQDDAQKALAKVDVAILSKDTIRAHLGAMQNRLENTITNLTKQVENLQTSEAQISDIDIATEMTTFVRNQILTQSAIAMLSQANSMKEMALKLIYA